ncbi:hypothetical protein JX265_009475 [Neoarthrinium moseri]|uniref:Uncharacterized protein n=1 Tax=Neoarthrinium moseri TaxID=1658444 RepID=A0A9Q0ALG3_9PEZI|nr:hypothetical protein JX265_009475 [Neoarthrinium moseri]
MASYSARPKRQRKTRLEPFSVEEKKAKRREYTTLYQSEPVNDTPFVNKQTLKGRDRIWGEWMQHCCDTDSNSQTTWVTFARRPQAPDAQGPFRAFLRAYVESSYQKRLALTSDEYEYVRTVDSAFSVQEAWRRLVASAEYHVMKDLRQKNPAEADTFRIRWISKDEGAREGPAYQIVKWIFRDLAPALDLDTNPDYRKIEMTTADIKVILSTLWERADVIPCEPDTRMSFHQFILMEGIGGFRRGTLISLTYSQLQVSIVRDPENPVRRRIVVTICVKRNKIRETAKTSRARNGGIIGFSVTTVPNRTFCLASMIITRAVKKDAFKAGYRTIDDILDTPNMEEGVNFIPLDWRPEITSQKALSLTSSSLDTLWKRVLQVAGYRELARVYSLRVGAGIRLDGVLSTALRNYVMSHTTRVFEEKYQSHIFPGDLAGLAFGSAAGKEDLLFAMLRDSSLSRDPNAPIEITPGEALKFEDRNDIKQLRAELSNARTPEDKRRKRSKLNQTLVALRYLQIDLNRSQYFQHADDRRARGLCTIPQPQTSKSKGDLVLAAVSGVIALSNPSADEPASSRDDMTRRYMIELLRYLNGSIISPCDPDMMIFTGNSTRPTGITDRTLLRRLARYVRGAAGRPLHSSAILTDMSSLVLKDGQAHV